MFSKLWLSDILISTIMIGVVSGFIADYVHSPAPAVLVALAGGLPLYMLTAPQTVPNKPLKNAARKKMRASKRWHWAQRE